VLLNWVWNYITYDNSIRMIVFAKKAKEVREREERERVTHLGTDLLGDKNLENTAN
jgi:NADH dehydrogenase